MFNQCDNSFTHRRNHGTSSHRGCEDFTQGAGVKGKGIGRVIARACAHGRRIWLRVCLCVCVCVHGCTRVDGWLYVCSCECRIGREITI